MRACILLEELEERRSERRRLSKLFFEREVKFTEDIFVVVAQTLAEVERRISATTHALKFCEFPLSNDAAFTRMMAGELLISTTEQVSNHHRSKVNRQLRVLIWY